MASWVSEFYEAYAKVILKSKGRVKIAPRPVDVAKVRGVPILCNKTDINNLLGCIFQLWHDLADMVEKETLDDIKAWFAPVIDIETPLWLDEGVVIEKKELNIPMRF